VLLDFDGTLAPIVRDPEMARPLPGTVAVLGRLVARYRLVGVVSGRPAAFLAEHLAVDGLARWGSYGLEEVSPDGSVVIAPAAREWAPVVASVVAAARAEAQPGVLVEDKGVSVTIHVRNAPAQEGWARGFAASRAQATGLVTHEAKMSVELRPPLDVDKGSVVASLVTASGVAGACFVGDDLGDLSAFSALRDLVDRGRLRWAVRVAVLSGESPPEVTAAADLTVGGPEGVLDLLYRLAG